MDEAVTGKLERVYVGRFSLEVPAAASRYGEEHEVRDLDLSEQLLAAPTEKAWEAAWGARLKEIEALKKKRLDADEIQGDIHSQVEVEPGRFRIVLYFPDNADVAVNFAALRRAGPVGLWLSRPGDLDFKDAILKTIAELGRAYVPVTVETPRPGGDVFHLPHGVVALPYRDQEKAKSVFKGGPLGTEIKVLTETTSEPKGGGLMARFGDAVTKAGAAFAAGASPVRNRGRTVAGMKGEEFVMRDSEEGNLYFMWEFKGEANSGARPRIQLQMITKEERQQEKMAYWDALVESLQPAAGE